MTDVATAAPLRRLSLRQSREELFRSERLKNLLEEFGLWTAVWTGFPVAEELPRAQAKVVGRPPIARNRKRWSLRDWLVLLASRGSGPSV